MRELSTMTGGLGVPASCDYSIRVNCDFGGRRCIPSQPAAMLRPIRRVVHRSTSGRRVDPKPSGVDFVAHLAAAMLRSDALPEALRVILLAGSMPTADSYHRRRAPASSGSRGFLPRIRCWRRGWWRWALRELGNCIGDFKPRCLVVGEYVPLGPH